MATRRERLEAKIEKRAEWAAGRREKAAALTSYTDKFRGDWAFNTQPGHIPERARVIRATEKSFDHVQMAQHHDSKAAGLADQLERSVFSDDADAIDQLRARIAANEEQRDRMKAINAQIRKGPGWQARLEAAGVTLTEGERKELILVAQHQPYYCDKATGAPIFPPYALTNLGARIRTDKERITDIERRQARTAKAEANGGATIDGPVGPDCGALVEIAAGHPWTCGRVAGHEEGQHYPNAEWIRVTFAEKPAREILDALRAAGYRWGAGSWVGPRNTLPAIVAGGAA